ncbi:hypothetical protein [Aneurinibacillus sp. UBA3580]|jgi:hypothetical protein|uniref:hypothetical protein n=1 Tax=Aneurinibacillus sp. UBA3580 TaxID=1946041 RepID=UPI00257BA5C6|nr:hypothetical protein [Aneurinibacillus sp. UBA3580]
MQTTNINKSIEIILDDIGYDVSYIDGMSDTDREDFCRLVAPYVQEWLAPLEPTFVHSITYITRALCHRFNVHIR